MRAPGKNFSKKIQAICNGKCAPSAMQGLARAREKPPERKQWKNNENNARSNGNRRKSGRGDLRKNKSPAAKRRRARNSVTRIYAIAHAAARCTQNKKRSCYSCRHAACAPSPPEEGGEGAQASRAPAQLRGNTRPSPPSYKISRGTFFRSRNPVSIMVMSISWRMMSTALRTPASPMAARPYR